MNGFVLFDALATVLCDNNDADFCVTVLILILILIDIILDNTPVQFSSVRKFVFTSSCVNVRATINFVTAVCSRPVGLY